MILTPIPPKQLASILDRFMAGLSDRRARDVFSRIRATSPDRAAGADGIVKLADPERLFPAPLGLSGAA